MNVTRIAPSPSGDMHFGTARAAYQNWLAARASGGKFILRIDDTNAKTNSQQAVDVILETMDWLGLDYDEIHYQSQNTDQYQKAVGKLLERGFAKKDGDAVRLDLYGPRRFWNPAPDNWHDEISGDIAISKDDLGKIDGMVLTRSDGSPTYHLASVCDDIQMGVNYIIRGTDHITNTSRQVALFAALEGVLPKFAHVGLIHHNKKKLSKRDNSASMLWYREKGYDPDAVLNFMLRMGWSPTVDDKTTKIIDRDRALEMFLTEGKMKSKSANMDLAKLESFDRKYKAAKGIWRNRDKLING
jgi:glutamyl-tRNA synthetase